MTQSVTMHGKLAVIASPLFLALVVALAGCSRGTKDTVQGRRIAPSVAPKAATQEPEAESIFDEEGVLKPSGEQLAWLELPMGFTERKSSQGTHHVYAGNVPVESVTRFFDRRVFTSKIELVGRGVQYKGAGPKTLDPKAMRFNIGIYPSPKGTRVQLIIDELPTEGSAPLTVEEARALISQMQQRAE